MTAITGIAAAIQTRWARLLAWGAGGDALDGLGPNQRQELSRAAGGALGAGGAPRAFGRD